MTSRSLLALLRLILGFLTLVAIGWQLTIQIQLGFSVVNFFSYFTNLSNVIAAVVLLLGAGRLFTRCAALEANDPVRAVSVVNMTVVGIVFAVLLRDADLGSLLPWVNVVLHYIMPGAVVLDWLLQPPGRKLGPRHLLLCQIFPACYLAYVLIRGSMVGWYPYPFLNPVNVGGYRGVTAYAVALAVSLLLAAWSLLALGNKLGRKAVVTSN